VRQSRECNDLTVDAMSALGQKRTFDALFDHLVGALLNL